VEEEEVVVSFDGNACTAQVPPSHRSSVIAFKRRIRRIRASRRLRLQCPLCRSGASGSLWTRGTRCSYRQRACFPTSIGCDRVFTRWDSICSCPMFRARRSTKRCERHSSFSFRGFSCQALHPQLSCQALHPQHREYQCILRYTKKIQSSYFCCFSQTKKPKKPKKPKNKRRCSNTKAHSTPR